MSQEPVPLLDLVTQYRPLSEEFAEALRPVIESQRFVLGEQVGELEGEIAGLTGARFGVGCASGTDALILALYALGVRPGDEVVVPAFTFFATAGAVIRLGARPVFCDIEPETFCMDAATLEPHLRPSTRAVVPVHLFGQPAPMAPILEMCRARGLPVLEDAAQAIGAAWRPPREAQLGCGAIGDAAAFSFFPTKNLGGWGDGGMVTTSDEAVAELLRKARVHGGTKMYHHEFVGWNSRLDSLQAAVLLAKLPHLAGWNRARQEHARRYGELFAEAGLVERGLVRPPVVREDARHVFHQYTVRAERRDELRSRLQERGIGSGVYYPLPLHLQECFAELGGREGQLPVCEQAAREVLSLPVYPELTPAQIERVAGAIADFYSGI
jgi:dTDP-4-amino-4,6-dideoxygalactose transaminase